MRYIQLALLIFLLPLNSVKSQKKRPSKTPKLVVQITISHMRNDYIQRYWDNYGDKGFKKLINEGTNFRNTKYNHTSTQEAVGNASIVTGTTPSQHGIIANTWYNRLKNEIIDCTNDEKYYALGGIASAGNSSPHNLLVSTLSDELKLSKSKESKVYSISSNSQSAVLMGGHLCDASYWFDSSNGNWTTNNRYLDSLPNWVNSFNSRKYPDIFKNRNWISSLPELSYIDRDSSNIKNSTKQILLADNSKNQKLKYAILSQTPFINTLTKDFAVNTIINERLGYDKITDYLSVNFSATKEIENKYGTTSLETEDCYLKLDRDLAAFIEFIDTEVGIENTLIILTSNAGIAFEPEKLKEQGIPGGVFNAEKAISLLKSYLSLTYGKGDWVKYYHKNQIYLNHELISESRLPLADVQRKVAEFMTQFNGINNAITAINIQSTNYLQGIYLKISNNFYSMRSGDVILLLNPGWIEDNHFSLGSNSGYNYETHVPMIWYGWEIKKQTVYREVSPIDIAPTLSTVLNISLPNSSTGNQLLEVLK